MDRITLNVSPANASETKSVVEAALEALTQANEVYYHRFPTGPCCPHCAGILYDPPSEASTLKPGQEFDGVERIIVKGHASCGPIAAMVAARMRVLKGQHARVVLIPQRIDAKHRNFHAVVQREDGTIYDPTEELQRLDACACGE